MVNCPILPYDFTKYAERLHEILVEMQEKSEKVRAYFNIYPVIERAKEFVELSKQLETAIERKGKSLSEDEIKQLNTRLMWISRHINPVAHSNAGPSEQMSMETFGALPFPRIAEIVDLADMTLHQSHEFKLLKNKLVRQRNMVEEGFYQANNLIKKTLASLE
jgi:hypothetical protein